MVLQFFGWFEGAKSISSFEDASALVGRAREAYRSHPTRLNQLRWSKAILSMLKFAQEYDQAKHAFHNSPPDTFVFRWSLGHWGRVCIRGIDDLAFDGFPDLLSRAKTIPDGAKTANRVLVHWVKACRSQEDAEKVARNTDERSKAGRMARRRWCELTIVSAKLASCVSDAQKALDHAPPDTEAYEFAQRLLARFL